MGTARFGEVHAKPIRTSADIVFCLDATGSMQPCINALKENILQFAGQLEQSGAVDFRLRLIAYRDLHDETAPQVPWIETRFTTAAGEFKSWLQPIEAAGGGKYRGAESTLDAIYRALRSEWREKVHKTIVIMTDDNTHETLHPTTYKGDAPGDTGLRRVVQEMEETKHLLVYMIAPDFPAYRAFHDRVARAGRKMIWETIPRMEQDEAHSHLASMDWAALFKRLAEKISISSQQVLAE